MIWEETDPVPGFLYDMMELRVGRELGGGLRRGFCDKVLKWNSPTDQQGGHLPPEASDPEPTKSFLTQQRVQNT